MQARYTPLAKVREFVTRQHPEKHTLVMLSTKDCRECRTQHNEILKFKHFMPSLKHFMVDAHEWNATFPQFAVQRVPVLYVANSATGLTVLSTGVMPMEELREKFGV